MKVTKYEWGIFGVASSVEKQVEKSKCGTKHGGFHLFIVGSNIDLFIECLAPGQ